MENEAYVLKFGESLADFLLLKNHRFSTYSINKKLGFFKYEKGTATVKE